MAEPELDATAPAPPPRWLTNADQVEQKHDEAVAVAVPCRAILRARIACSIGMKRPYTCDRKYTPVL